VIYLLIIFALFIVITAYSLCAISGKSDEEAEKQIKKMKGE